MYWTRRRRSGYRTSSGRQRGSASVFLVMILATMLTLTLVFLRAADRQADTAYADGVFYLAGRSVLAGYDRALKEDYGILAFSGTERQTADAIEYYAAPSLKHNGNLSVETLNVELGKYSLLSTEVFQKEISGYTKYALARSLILDRDPGGEAGPLDLHSEKVLRNRQVLGSLPSAGTSKGGHLWQAVKRAFSDIDKVFRKGADNVLTEVYIQTHFKNAQEDIPERETFFRYETEYILKGHPSDQKNLEAVRDDLFLTRNAADLLFLYTDPAKHAELLAAAELMAPGPAGVLVEVVLAELWAAAEAENDVRLLEHGKMVPLLKSEASWATDLDSVLEGADEGYIDPSNQAGFLYRDYLRMFLFFMDGPTKLLRMMDLIQINMQGNHDAGFYIRDHSVGLSLSVKAGGRIYYYDHTY